MANCRNKVCEPHLVLWLALTCSNVMALALMILGVVISAERPLMNKDVLRLGAMVAE